MKSTLRSQSGLRGGRERAESLWKKFPCIFQNLRLVHSNSFLKKGGIWLKLAQRFAGNPGENKNLMLIFKIKFRKHQAIYPNSTQLDF